jgi:hypothetical protein
MIRGSGKFEGDPMEETGKKRGGDENIKGGLKM